MQETTGQIERYDIARGRLRATVLNIGAALSDLSIDMSEGPRPVILRHGTPEAYRDNRHYLGAIAGRCANRIRDGEVTIGGISYQLDRNENGTTHLHGGKIGVSRRLWTLKWCTGTAVELTLRSMDGDQGYPGNADMTCTYEMLPEERLRITLMARSDADTLMNLAVHGYFNLQPGSSILDHRLWVNAGCYTPVDRDLIPDGRILAVEGTCFDFRELARIGDRRDQSPIGYDHNLVLASARRAEPRHAASLVSPGGDLTVDMFTTEPGLQFYDGHKLSADPGDPGSTLRPFAGCCLEPQRFPDANHHPDFAQSLLRAGETYRQVTEYRFR